MACVQAKRFEWHRGDADVSRARALRRDAAVRGDAADEVARLTALLDAAEERSRALMADIEALRRSEPERTPPCALFARQSAETSRDVSDAQSSVDWPSDSCARREI